MSPISVGSVGMARGSSDESQPSNFNRVVARLLVVADGEDLPPLTRGELGDVGEAEANEGDGVDAYNDPDVAEDAIEDDLLVFARPFRTEASVDEEADDDATPSSHPQEARTFFSTFTVSSRNISESWSRYPGHTFDTRIHCVHSGCRLSHFIRRLRHDEQPKDALPQ